MLAFIHIQKTAGITLKWILRSTYGINHCDVEPARARITQQPFNSSDLKSIVRFYPHLSSIAGHRVVPYSDLETIDPDIKYIALIRDPLMRSASWFQHLVQAKRSKSLDFGEHIQTKFARNRQTFMLSGSYAWETAAHAIGKKNIFVGLTEEFDLSLLLLKQLVDPNLCLGYVRKNVAPSNQISRILLKDDHTRQLLIEANQQDIALYEYVKEEIFPEYKRKYGGTLEKDLERFRVDRGGFNYFNVNMSRLKLFLLLRPYWFLYRTGLKLFE